MALIISGISLPFTTPPQAALDEATKLLKGNPYKKAFIVKKSIDARRKDAIKFVYSVGVEVDGDENTLAQKLQNSKITVKQNTPLEVPHGTKPLATPPIIVGFGPAGMFAGLLLAREGYRPIIIERGEDVDTRVNSVDTFWQTGALNTKSNVQFGEGGAGTFSDGKLTTRIGDPRCNFILEELVRYGAPEEILWKAKPHVGTDKLRNVVKNIREEIIRLGGEVSFREKLENFSFAKDGSIKAVHTNKGERNANVVLLALGHSARDTFSMLLEKGITLEPKPFSVGARIEHLQSDIDQMLYGKQAGHPLLPKGEYQLSHRQDNRAVYTFCMCPGGVVVPAASQEGMVTTNGMSAYARDEDNANSALVVSVDLPDFEAGPLGGVALQERLERAAFVAGGGNYTAPAQTVGDFLAGSSKFSPQRISPSYARGVVGGNFSKILPAPVVTMMQTGLGKFQNKLRGFADKDVLLTGVETRTSSPVRILRNPTMQSVSTPGLYPCGEGAGYAGGIVSAAVDGLRSAQAVMEEYTLK